LGIKLDHVSTSDFELLVVLDRLDARRYHVGIHLFRGVAFAANLHKDVL
jgi:hypothetical protein